MTYFVCGEWREGPFSGTAVLMEFDALVRHEVLGNQFWWIETENGNEVILIG